MAGRPPKPIALVKMEGKSHRTKAEIKQREEAESGLLTGVSLQSRPEVKSDPVAKKEFNRVKKLLKIIEKDDAIYESVINRYCVLTSEAKQQEADIKDLRDSLEGLEPEDKAEIYKTISSAKRELMEIRKMLFQIEKDSIMTPLAALRSIPKQEPNKKESPMAEYLKSKAKGR